MKKHGKFGLAALFTILAILAFGGANRLYAASEEEFQIENAILVKYNGTDTKVSVPITVSSIGPGAFRGNRKLKSVTLPATIESIGMGAFENCENLGSISIPEGCGSIGPSAFSGCSMLVRASIPASVERIGSGAFSGCDILSDVYIHAGNLRYLCVDGAIYDFKNNMLLQYLAGRLDTSYYMPDAIDKMESYAFWGADGLKYAQLAPYVKEVDAHAFAGCKGLEEVMLPEALTKIDAGAFQNCTGLARIEIPNSVKFIDDTAFDGCNNLVIQAQPGSYGAGFAAAFKEKQAKEKSSGTGRASAGGSSGTGKTSASAGEKQGTGGEPSGTGETSASTGTASGTDRASASGSASKDPGETLGEAKIVGSDATVWVQGGRVFDGYQVEEDEEEPPGGGLWEEGYAEGSGPAGGSEGGNGDFLMVENVLAAYNGTAALVRIPDNTQAVGNRAFYKKQNVKSVGFSENVGEIGDFAFTRSGLLSVSLPEGLKDIGYGAFYQCGSLKNVKIPDTVERIGLAAFQDTPWLNHWYSNGSEDFLVVGDGILLAYKGNRQNVSIPPSVKQIGPGCFKGHGEIQKVSLPEGLTRIGEDAFNGCAALSGAKLPESLLFIEDRAFNGCPLTDVRIPSGVKAVGMRSFDRPEGPAANAPQTEAAKDKADSTEAQKDAEHQAANTVAQKDAGHQAANTVVFEGSVLPVLSYNESADRLDNANLRGPAFAGFDLAVAPQETGDFSGTVLEEGGCGFDGEIRDESGRVLRASKGGGARDGKTEENEAGQKSGITIRAEHPAIPRGGLAAAFFDGPVEGSYELRVSADPNARLLVKKALLARREKNGPVRYEAMDISLYQEDCPVSIKSLSGREVTLTLPIPESMAQNAQKVRIMSVGSSGEFEPVAARTVRQGKSACIQFQAEHFSAFAFYLETDG